jgi:hypothetical protein
MHDKGRAKISLITSKLCHRTSDLLTVSNRLHRVAERSYHCRKSAEKGGQP